MSKPKVVQASPPEKEPSSESLKRVGGSRSDGFNNIVCNQVLSAIWPSSNPEQLTTQYEAALAGMMGIEPRDEIEGMLAAQMVATHSAAMECYRRAMLDNQTFEGRRENLNQANKLTRSYATLMEALNRHRGKGQQKVTVEHVHVHQGGQAIVGNVTPGGGVSSKLEDQPVATALSFEPGQTLPSEIETFREAVPSAGS
jgi:hypothetical protein